MMYVFSISLQVAGALILMFNSLSTNRNNVIKRLAGHTLIYRDNNENEIDYDEKVFKSLFKEAYLSKFSFLYIAVGYFVGIFATSDAYNKAIMALGAIFFTIIFIAFAYIIMWVLIQYNPKINKKITNEELIELGIEPDIENAPVDEIIEIFKNR